MPVVIHPADGSVLAYNTVFRIIHLGIAGRDLLENGIRDLLIVIRMDHTLEFKSRIRLEIFQVCAAVNVDYGFIRINQFLGFLCLINKKTTSPIGAIGLYFIIRPHRSGISTLPQRQVAARSPGLSLTCSLWSD